MQISNSFKKREFTVFWSDGTFNVVKGHYLEDAIVNCLNRLPYDEMTMDEGEPDEILRYAVPGNRSVDFKFVDGQWLDEYGVAYNFRSIYPKK